MPIKKSTRMALLAAMTSSGGPVLNLDLTSSLPASITFSSPARTAIVNGVLTSLTANTPTFESWYDNLGNIVNRGLALEPGFTNLFLQSGDLTNAATNKGAVTVVAGDVGPGLITQLYTVAATATANFHFASQTINSVAASTTHTLSAFFKAAAGATSYSLYLNLANQFNNGGECYHFRIDGNEGFYYATDSANMTNVTYGWRKLSGGIYQVWITGTWSATGNKNYKMGVTAKTATDARNYTALTTDSFQVGNPTIAAANGPTSYVSTGASGVALAATTASFNDTSWLTTAQGTFVVEHDCVSGPVIGSGANTIIAASGVSRYGTTKVALAWDGTTSDLVVNGGATTPGGLPTFSGTDIRLLATSGAKSAGHIKSIKFYNTRLSVGAMQTLTQPSISGTANPGTLRAASVDNRMPASQNTTSGTALSFYTRARLKLGTTGCACSKLKLRFPNFDCFAGATGNSLSITECYLERVTGVSESIQVLVGGSGTFSVASGAVLTISDDILPSSFTSLTQFDSDMVFYVRVKGSVASAGQKIPGCRQAETTTSPDNLFGRIYDPAAVTWSPASGTGVISKLTGTDPGQLTASYCPVLLGTFVSGDPVTDYIAGDSLVEGTNGLNNTGTFMTLIHRNLGIPRIEMSKGGQSQVEAAAHIDMWGEYMQYCRVLYDMLGTNNLNAFLEFFTYWNPFRKSYGGDKVVKFTLLPNVSYTGAKIAESDQTVNAARPYPASFPDNWSSTLVAYGPSQMGVEAKLETLSVRGVNQAKWIVDGVTANYASPDGVHPNPVTTALLVTEFQPLVAAVTVT